MPRITTEQHLPTRRFEDKAHSLGYARIAGIDEAGRGPLAGPVVAAAVILPLSNPPAGLKDSKLLTEQTRQKLFHEINSMASVGVGIVSNEIIDQINILQATRQAMVLAVKELKTQPDYLLIDGPISLDLSIPQQGIVKGDRLSLSVAAASVIAKVTRDRVMADLHREYPQYGFDRHKGYPTKAHFEAILMHGSCPAHRKSFRGVREVVK